MATRAYNSESRLRKQAERKARIAAAAAALHAEKGANATSYAEIAAKAKVSLPTVYAHFPTQRELLQGCTEHVAARAPALPVERVLAATDLPAAAELLADAIEQRHLHFEPWLAWREDRVIPFLAKMSGDVRDEMAALIARVLKRHLGPGEHREVVAGWESALSFDFWHRLARGHRLSRPAVRRVIVQCLQADRRAAGRIRNQVPFKEKAMKPSAVASIDEIAPETYRVNVALPDAMPGGFSFNQYLVVDEMPLLFHTGPKKLFPLIREQIETVLPAFEASLHRLLARRVGRVRQPVRVPACRSRVASGVQRRRGDGLHQRSRGRRAHWAWPTGRC